MKVGEYKKYLIKELSQIYDERESSQIVNRLLEEILNLNRVDAVLNASDEIQIDKLDLLNSILKDLSSAKPLDYILGKTIFFGRDFIVDDRVLIPRPETEELVQYILEREQEKKISIFDIGTGSACIPISLKLEGGYQEVDACEFSERALENAIENAKNLKADIELFQMDILKDMPKKKYDIVVSNPPYVFQEELYKLNKNVREFEPLVALAPEGEPLLFYKRILGILPSILKSGGRVYFEIHEEMGEKINVLMRHYGLQKVEVVEDMYGRDRIASGTYNS